VEAQQVQKDIRARNMLGKQTIVWEVNQVLLASASLLLMGALGEQHYLGEIHAAMGCDVRRDN
jgi:hypothetical protein